MSCTSYTLEINSIGPSDVSAAIRSSAALQLVRTFAKLWVARERLMEDLGEPEVRPGRGPTTSGLRFVALTSYSRRIVSLNGKGVALSASICASAITRILSISRRKLTVNTRKSTNTTQGCRRAGCQWTLELFNVLALVCWQSCEEVRRRRENRVRCYLSRLEIKLGTFSSRSGVRPSTVPRTLAT